MVWDNFDHIKRFLREPKPPSELAREFKQARILANSRRLKAITWLMIPTLLAFTAVDCVTVDWQTHSRILSTILVFRFLAVCCCILFVPLFGKLESTEDLKPRHNWLWLVHIHLFLAYTAIMVGVMFPVKMAVDPIYVFLLGPVAFLSMTRSQAVALQLVGVGVLALSLGALVPGSSDLTKYPLINIAILTWVSLVVARITYGGSLRDFLNRKTIEKNNEELETARARAEAGSRAKSEFLAAVSHEIRTPMNAILGMLEVTLRTPLSSAQREYVGTARESAVHLLDILGDILDFSRIEAGKLRLISTHFDLTEVVESAMKTIQLQARQKDVDTEFDIKPETPRFLKGDPGRVRQVLVNLLNNAVKFTDEGCIRVTVGLWSESDTDPDRPVGLCFSVRDSGVGIDGEEQAAIFEAFTQVDGSSSRSHGGSGLGLAICRELVDCMGGAVSVSSSPGNGSEFVFTARFGKGDPKLTVKNEALAVPWIETASVTPSRILLVEDNQLNQRVEKLHLDKLGMDTTVAQSGTEALMLLAERDFDLVLMDLEMPGMDGHETTRRIRSGKGAGQPVRQPDVPILAVTAHALGEVRSQCERGGMNGFVTKPLGIGELAAAMRHILGESRPEPMSRKVSMEGVPVLNLTRAAEELGLSPADVRHLVPGAMDEIRHKSGLAEKGVLSGALRETALQAHTLKSIAASIGAEAARRAAVKLENASRRNDVNLSSRRLAEFRVEVVRLEGAVKAL